MVISQNAQFCEDCKNKKGSVYFMDTLLCWDCKRKWYLAICKRTIEEDKRRNNHEEL